METKVVYVPAAGKVYLPEELAEIFGKIGVHDPVVVGLRQILLQRYTAAAGAASDARLSEREAGHAGGRIEEILSLQAELMTYLGASAASPAEEPEAIKKRGRR